MRELRQQMRDQHGGGQAQVHQPRRLHRADDEERPRLRRLSPEERQRLREEMREALRR